MNIDTLKLVFLLQSKFNLNLARTKCFSALIIGVIAGTTVNLTKLSVYLPSIATNDSKYRRIQRFFAEVNLSADAAAQFIYERLPVEEIELAMDRTNWQLKGLNINILYVAVIYQGVAIPIMWMLLDKKGNSNTDERIELMNRFKNVLTFKKVKSLLADREFIGKAWFSYLHDNNIKIRIRTTETTHIETCAEPVEVSAMVALHPLKTLDVH